MYLNFTLLRQCLSLIIHTAKLHPSSKQYETLEFGNRSKRSFRLQSILTCHVVSKAAILGNYCILLNNCDQMELIFLELIHDFLMMHFCIYEFKVATTKCPKKKSFMVTWLYYPRITFGP